MICHNPLTVDRESTSLDLEPVPSLHVPDGAVVPGEGEELLPQLEAGHVWPHVLLGVWQHTQARGVTCRMDNETLFLFSYNSLSLGNNVWESHNSLKLTTAHPDIY